MSRVLVTGGAGYIGSILVPELLAQGHSVTVVDLFNRGDTALAACCHHSKFTPIRADVRDSRILAEVLPKNDVIIPLAALVGAPLCDADPITATMTNRDSILSLVNMTSSDQRIIFPTTNSGYGQGEGSSFCTESSPLKPVSLYGQTKVDAETAILDSGKGVTLRLATVFGMAPRMRLDLLVNDFTWRAVHDRTVVIFQGHFKRNFIHIRDVSAAFLHVVSNYEQMRGECFNVGLSSANLSKLELCAVIKEVVPHFLFLEAPIGEDPDKRDYIVSNDKIERTGWRPEYSLETGIRELVKGYQMLRNSRFSNV